MFYNAMKTWRKLIRMHNIIEIQARSDSPKGWWAQCMPAACAEMLRFEIARKCTRLHGTSREYTRYPISKVNV